MVAEASSPSLPEPTPRTRRRPWWVWVILGVLVLVVLLALYFFNSARTLQPSIAALRTDSSTLERQLRAGDFASAATTMGKVRSEAASVHSATSGPIWALAAHVPVVGSNLGAVRTIAQVGADVTTAAQPLEAALPSLSPAEIKAKGGAIDTGALARVGAAMPALSATVTDGAAALDAIDTSGLQRSIAQGVEQIRKPLDDARGPMAAARTSIPMLPALLGADGKRTYFVMLQQDAEARGTGGLMGAYALITVDKGKLTLVETKPRGVLQDHPIPSSSAVPQELQDLWGQDLTEWAGLNLSPHFPWTGQLVSAGWARRTGEPQLDGVIAIDGEVVRALIAGTGPVSAGGVQLTKDNTATVLAKDIYTKYPDPDQVDAATGALVQQVFSKLTSGQFDLSALVAAMKEPYAERRLLMWSGHADEEQQLSTMTLGGAVPSTPGPFAMTVVNNGGGDKLDAYLKVATHYEPGACTSGVRIGAVTVDLTNTAPASGLPDYVSVRSDLVEAGQPNPVVGSNRVLVDVYGPVGSEAPLATVDGQDATVLVSGVDQGHTVTRVVVVVNPGQHRTLEVTVVDPAAPGTVAPTTLTQPMVLPATTTVGALPACS